MRTVNWSLLITPSARLSIRRSTPRRSLWRCAPRASTSFGETLRRALPWPTKTSSRLPGFFTISHTWAQTAAYGKTHMMPRTRKSRPRPPRGKPAEPRRTKSAVAVDQQEWVFLPAPTIVDKALFASAQDQLRENALAPDWDCGGLGISSKA